MFGVFQFSLSSVTVLNISLLFILFLTVHRKTNFLVNFSWDNKDSNSESDTSFVKTIPASN